MDFSNDWNHFYCGSENHNIRIFNKNILFVKSKSKLKNIPQYQEYFGHSGRITKLQLRGNTLVSSSNNSDGFFVWKSKGSYTSRVRNET